MNKLLKYMVMLSMVMAMTSCGTVGLLIHTAKIVNDIQSFSVNSACDTIRFVVNKKNQMLLKAIQVSIRLLCSCTPQAPNLKG